MASPLEKISESEAFILLNILAQSSIAVAIGNSGSGWWLSFDDGATRYTGYESLLALMRDYSRYVEETTVMISPFDFGDLPQTDMSIFDTPEVKQVAARILRQERDEFFSLGEKLMEESD